MKNEKILVLERMGCDFWPDSREAQLSDCENHRIETRRERVTGKDGREYFLSFGGYTRYNWRTTNRRNGKPLKNAIRELDYENALHIDTEYEDAAGAWRNLKIEDNIRSRRLHYTKADILRAVNSFSAEKYTAVEIV